MKKEQRKKPTFDYFTKPFGRRLVFIAAGTTALGLIAANYLPHTFGLKYYRNFVQSYENGIARPVSDKVLTRVYEAMDRLNLNSYERIIVKPFTVVGFDLFQAGSIKYRSGAILGIPLNYEYSDASDIKRADILFRNQNINWQSEPGKLLEESIVLTDEEQFFGLCKTILQLQTHRVSLNCIFPTVSFLTVYTVGHYINNKMNLFARPFSLRFVMYTILGLFGIGNWMFMKDFSQVNYDVDVDKKLSEMGPEVVKAGVSYYDKLLKRNMALRALIGDDTYTAKGNENYLVRQKSLPITMRKSFFEEKLKDIVNSTQSAELKQ